MYEELKGQNFEIVAAAQDTGGEAAAGQWYDRAKATFTTLIDVQHSISTAYQFINVPMGIWVDERGRVVRPAEPAWTNDSVLKIGPKNITTEGTLYLTALRDWVAHGEQSKFALSDEEFARRVKPRSHAEMEADASFKLAVYFHEQGDQARAEKYFAHAQQLNPDDWNYHRQDWSFTPQEAGKKWLDKFNKLDEPYYPKLDMPAETKKP